MLSREQIIERLEEIEQDLGTRGPGYGKAAEDWTRKKREQEKVWADTYATAAGDAVTDKKAAAIKASIEIGKEEEATFVGHKAVVDVLQTRAMIGMALLKSHDRVEAPVSPTGQTYGGRRAASCCSAATSSVT
jgi:hypothetical protein